MELAALYAAAVALLMALVLLVGYRRRLVAVSKKALSDQACEGDGEGLPPVTVVVYACDNSAQLEQMLPALLTQDYPQKMEVIVVNDGSSEKISDLVDALRASYRNLRLTFIPDEAHNLSRKKLAITLGVKGATTDCVVLTEASCVVGSPTWLRRMCRHFADGKDVVLGNAVIEGLSGPMRRLDYLADAVGMFSAAILGRPYRGYGMNLGYRRKLFFDNKGFARSLNLHCGDDDMFISQITTSGNTAVELSHDASVAIDDPMPNHLYREEKLNHLFTARFARKGGRRVMGFYSVVTWAWLLATVAAAALALPDPIVPAAMALVAVGLWWPLTAAWIKAGKALEVKTPGAALIPLLLWRPFRNWRLKRLSGKKDRRNYTWLQSR